MPAATLLHPLLTLGVFAGLLVDPRLPAAVAARANRELLENPLVGPVRNLVYKAPPGRFRSRVRAFLEGIVIYSGMSLAGVALLAALWETLLREPGERAEQALLELAPPLAAHGFAEVVRSGLGHPRAGARRLPRRPGPRCLPSGALGSPRGGRRGRLRLRSAGRRHHAEAPGAAPGLAALRPLARAPAGGRADRRRGPSTCRAR